MSFQTTDSKKEEFRKYLEKSGVIDQLTRVLVGLYEEPEKPSNAIECFPRSFIKKYLGAPSDVDTETLRAEHEALKERNAELERQVEELRRELEALRPSDD